MRNRLPLLKRLGPKRYSSPARIALLQNSAPWGHWSDIPSTKPGAMARSSLSFRNRERCGLLRFVIGGFESRFFRGGQIASPLRRPAVSSRLSGVPHDRHAAHDCHSLFDRDRLSILL